MLPSILIVYVLQVKQQVNPYWQILENSSKYFSQIPVFWVMTLFSRNRSLPYFEQNWIGTPEIYMDEFSRDQPAPKICQIALL